VPGTEVPVVGTKSASHETHLEQAWPERRHSYSAARANSMRWRLVGPSWRPMPRNSAGPAYPQGGTRHALPRRQESGCQQSRPPVGEGRETGIAPDAKRNRVNAPATLPRAPDRVGSCTDAAARRLFARRTGRERRCTAAARQGRKKDPRQGIAPHAKPKRPVVRARGRCLRRCRKSQIVGRCLGPGPRLGRNCRRERHRRVRHRSARSPSCAAAHAGSSARWPMAWWETHRSGRPASAPCSSRARAGSAR
jgi:hypothetical protein